MPILRGGSFELEPPGRDRGFDFASTTSDTLHQRAMDATFKPAGVIVAGDRTTRSAGSYVDELRTVGQFYLPVR